MENQFFVDSEHLSPAALEKKHRLENDPTSRKNHMEYMPGMEIIESDVCCQVMSQMESYDYSMYTARDVQAALDHDTCSIEDFKALLSPAAEPFLEEMAQRARIETSKHFGNTVYLFTPLYIANYCENYCVYCGFNCYNHINRMKLNIEQIEHEMKVIADSGMEEILILTGESRAQSDVTYIGEACKLARKYFRMVGLEIYPVNTDEYRYLHECGADYVTVFQETYNADKYETLHLFGHKRVWPYRFDAQERALRGGMRGVAFSALLGLSDFRKDALASALHVYYLQRKYPQAEMSLSCPRLRPIINNEKINPLEESFIEEAIQVKALCHRYGVPLIINDNVEVALKSGADGVHVGIEDAPVAEIRKCVPADFIIGATCKTVDLAQIAEAAGANYMGVGAVFPSPTKTNAICITNEQLQTICSSVSIPAVAIGGISRDNVLEIKGSGVDGIAVVSAIFAAEDIQAATADLKEKAKQVAAR